MPTLDCIIPVHAKDVCRLKRCVAYARANIPALGRISVVTAPKNFGRVREELANQDSRSIQLVSEDEFLPRWHIGSIDREAGWLLQQLIKLEGRRLASTEHYLVLDADVVFLNETALLDDAGRALFAVDPARPKFEAHPLGLPCRSFCSIAHHFLGTDFEIHDECYICHHMVFHKPRVAELLRSLGEPKRISRQVVPVTETWSEYDFYAHLLKHRYPDSFRVRSEPWLDVPWSGDWDGRLLDSFLSIFKEARVEFVAIHHHFDTRLSVADCFDFAVWATQRIADPDTRGRWPLFRYLSMKTEDEGVNTDATAACRRVFSFLFAALSKALAILVVKYAHVREGRSFRASPAMYSESALRDLESNAQRWREAVSLCMQPVLGPTLARLPARRGKRLKASFDDLDAALVSVERELSHRASDVLGRNLLSRQIDRVRKHWSKFRQLVKETDLLPGAELESHWRGLDESSLVALLSFGARWLPAPIAELARVLGPERFKAVAHLLREGPTAETFPDRGTEFSTFATRDLTELVV